MWTVFWIFLTPALPRRGEGGNYVFDPPPFFTEDFRKIDRGIFQKKTKPAAGENFWGPFFQRFDGFSKFSENLTVFCGFNGF